MVTNIVRDKDLLVLVTIADTSLLPKWSAEQDLLFLKFWKLNICILFAWYLSFNIFESIKFNNKNKTFKFFVANLALAV